MGSSHFSPLIVGIGGTARPESTTERALSQALSFCESQGATTKLFGGEFISELPLYVPHSQARSSKQEELVTAIRQCHGIIVSTPGYHGGMSAVVKNALDLLEDTARDERPYLTDRPFGCIVSAYGWQACGTALVSLRIVAHALRAWPTPLGVTINASTPPAEDVLSDDKVTKSLSMLASQVMSFSRWHAAGVATR